MGLLPEVSQTTKEVLARDIIKTREESNSSDDDSFYDRVEVRMKNEQPAIYNYLQNLLDFYCPDNSRGRRIMRNSHLHMYELLRREAETLELERSYKANKLA